MTLEIRKVLVLSTVHVPPELAKSLDSMASPSWPVCGGPWAGYGWFMYAHEPNLDHPPELNPVFEFARENGCDYVLFDCDACEVDILTKYDWN